MAMGQLDHARRALMRAQGRGAEWNYLFGAILMRRGEYEKAAVYFGVSTRMSPDCPQYRAALRSAEALRDRSPQTCVAARLGSTRRCFLDGTGPRRGRLLSDEGDDGVRVLFFRKKRKNRRKV